MAGGDSGPTTTLGAYVGLKVAVAHKLNTDIAEDMTVGIQGLGKVGMELAKNLHEKSARVLVAYVGQDAVEQAVERFGATAMSADEIVTADCDVLSPNALGAILNDETLPKLKAKVVAGAANNQLARDEHGEMLKSAGVLYAPDYVINAGGIIRVVGQIFGWNNDEIEKRTMGVGPTLSVIFDRAEAEGRTINLIADRMAEERMAKVKGAEAQATE